MGSNPMAGRQPFLDLPLIHQGSSLPTFGGFPVTRLSNPVGHEIIDRPASGGSHPRNCLGQVADEAIIKSDGDRQLFSGLRPCRRRKGKSGPTQLVHLSGKKIRMKIEPFDPRLRRHRFNLVVTKDRPPLAEMIREGF